MNAKTCPDQESLRKLLLGELRGPQAEQLEEHLLDCDECSAAADTISASDELTAAIQSPDVVYGESDIVRQVIERGKQLRSQAETVETDETIITDRALQAENASDASFDGDETTCNEEIDFLAPAQDTDEIGRLGDYRVLDVLGIGGMGVVFRAEDPKLKRQIALKAMKPVVAASMSAKDRFVREAQATAAIEHDNIVHIYQVGEDRNIPFIAMQFLRGESLQKQLDREKRLDQREVLRIGREVAAGLAAAHQRELVHRDIKPDNIWIEEETGRAKILDFGLVRTSSDDAGLTQSGMVLGTPRYMAPEQAQGQPVDHRCDLFSLGSVLYHLATGRPPFEGGNLTAMLIAVAQRDPDPVEQVCPQIELGLSQLIMRLLSKDRDQRPQSAAEVSKAISDIEKKLTADEAERIRQQRVAETTEIEQSPVAKPQHAPAPRPGEVASRSPLLFGGAAVTIALAVFAWLYVAGFIVKFESEDGTLIVKFTGDDFVTSVKGRKVTIKNTETDQTITIDLNSPEVSESLKPGSYFMLKTESGLTTQTDRFTIRSGADQVVEVTWKPKPQVSAGDGIRDLPSPDRVGAEWVQSINNHHFTYIVIRQNGVERKIGHEELKAERALPTEPFELTGVFLQYNRDLTDEGLVNLRGCRHLTLLNFTYSGIGDAGLVHLPACCPNLLELHLPAGVTDAGLANFKECRELRRLTLHGVRADTTGLQNFRHCKKLTSLSLLGVILTGDSLESFAGCMELENLNLVNTRLDAAELAHFKDCRNLKKLELSGNPAITNKELGYFQNCRELTTVVLARTNVDDKGLSFLSEFKRLRSLDIHETNVSGAFLESFQTKRPNCKISGKPKELSPAGNLEPHAEKIIAADQRASEYIISVGGLLMTDRSDQWTDVVPAGPFRLTGVDLSGKPVTDEGLAAFRRCADLETLNLSGTGITDAGVVHFKNCKKLTVLNLGTKVTNEGLAHFQDCERLESLTLTCSTQKITDAGLAFFKNCRELNHLYLHHANVGDAGLAQLKACQKLARLHLDRSKVTDAGLAQLKDWPELQSLILSYENVTDAGMAHLKNCQSLTNLNLAGMRVTDVGIADLKECKGLTSIRIARTPGVSREMAEELKQALPNCEVNWFPAP